MNSPGIELVWITVSNLKDAIEFYTQTLGMTLLEHHEAHGWAEVGGSHGARLGLAQHSPEMGGKPGVNAVSTLKVKDLDEALSKLQEKGVHLVGEILEIPGHIKMQTFCDADGNTFQICQILETLHA